MKRREGSGCPAEMPDMPLNAMSRRTACTTVSLEPEFGRDYSTLERAFGWATSFVYEHHRHRVMNYLHYWAPYFEYFAQGIGRKVGEEWAGIFCIAFIDGTVRRVCRPDRMNDLQRGVHDGHHRDHRLAYQAITLPNGMFLDFFGPVPGRRHDSYLLSRSRFNERMRDLAVEQNMTYKFYAYGDAGYPKLDHVQSGFGGTNITPVQRECNRRMSARIAVESSFGKVSSLWPFVDYREFLKLLNALVGKYYINAALLTNASTCVYGSLTSAHFAVPPPSLQHYFAG